jgi:hypothetical protein
MGKSESCSSKTVVGPVGFIARRLVSILSNFFRFNGINRKSVKYRTSRNKSKVIFDSCGDSVGTATKLDQTSFRKSSSKRSEKTRSQSRHSEEDVHKVHKELLFQNIQKHILTKDNIPQISEKKDPQG